MLFPHLRDRLDALSRFDSHGARVLSLYLDTRVDGTGQRRHDLFLRKELPSRLALVPEHSPARSILEDDGARAMGYLAGELRAETEGVAIFACGGAGLFEAFQLEAPFENTIVVNDRPYLYPFARLLDQQSPCAAVIADTNLARIMVVESGRIREAERIETPKTKQVKIGGWSQSRIQRHIEHARLLHAKAVAERLEALTDAEKIPRVVIAGDEVIVPLLKEQFSPRVAARVIDVLRLDIRTPDSEVLVAVLDAIRLHDGEADEAIVRDLVDAARAGGLAVVGVEESRKALEQGQVDTLVIAASPQEVEGAEQVADELVTTARRTSAAVRFIEWLPLLHDVGGVGARLRYHA